MKCARVRPRLGDHLEGDLDLSLRAQLDEHLTNCPNCATELRELRSTVAHVRSLSIPNPPPDLSQRVMRRIEAGEGRRQRFPIAIGRLLDPVWLAPLAAGITGFALLTTLEIEFVEPTEVAAVSPRDAEIAAQKAIEMWTAEPPTLARKQKNIIRPRLTAIERSAARRFYQPEPDAAVAGFYGRLDPDLQQLDLDAQLDRAKLNPAAFLRRLASITELERSSTIAPLVIRAARRGDAPLVAQRLRDTSHPLASSISAQFDRWGQGRSNAPLAVPVSTR